MRGLDWSATPVGPVAGLAPEPQGAVVHPPRVPLPHVVWWGPDEHFYNDAYRPTLGASGTPAPWQSGPEVWAEIWEDIGPLMEHVLREGRATWDEDCSSLLERNGYPEETYHTFSYSPIPDDTAASAACSASCTEETGG